MLLFFSSFVQFRWELKRIPWELKPVEKVYWPANSCFFVFVRFPFQKKNEFIYGKSYLLTGWALRSTPRPTRHHLLDTTDTCVRLDITQRIQFDRFSERDEFSNSLVFFSPYQFRKLEITPKKYNSNVATIPCKPAIIMYFSHTNWVHQLYLLERHSHLNTFITKRINHIPL